MSSSPNSRLRSSRFSSSLRSFLHFRSGEVRYKYKHSIPATRFYNGHRIEAGQRVSIMLRDKWIPPVRSLLFSSLSPLPRSSSLFFLFSQLPANFSLPLPLSPPFSLPSSHHPPSPPSTTDPSTLPTPSSLLLPLTESSTPHSPFETKQSFKEKTSESPMIDHGRWRRREG